MDQSHIKTNGITLHVVHAGPEIGPLVILLHGFPEFWYGWHRQITYLAAAGYRVWAPDQRGYNLSDKPDAISSYSLDELAADVVGLIDAAGRETAILVGHDWGAAVAWWTAGKYPQRLTCMTAINVPHGDVMRKMLGSSLSQLRKSWYMFAFQIPALPEAICRHNNWELAAKALIASSRPGTFSPGDLQRYRQAWAQPGAIRAMLNWYRAVFQYPSSPPPCSQIVVPTMLIWGAQDRFLSRELAQPSIDHCDDGRLIFVEDASHWVHHEEPEQVNYLLHRFLDERKGTTDQD